MLQLQATTAQVGITDPQQDEIVYPGIREFLSTKIRLNSSG